MNELASAFRQTVASLADTGFEIFDGFVVSINEGDGTCDVNISGEGEPELVLPGVSMRSVADGDKSGIMFIPEVGAHVVFCKVEGQSDYVLIKTSKLKKTVLNCDNIVFNEGLNEGLVKAPELTEKLNALEKQLNELKQILSSWTPVPQDGGAALKGVISSWAGNSLLETQQSEIENDKIKH